DRCKQEAFRLNLWRERTNLRTGSERLTGVGLPVVAHRMLRSSLGQSLALPGWPSTPRCIGDIGNENLRQRDFDGDDLHRHLLGLHGAATGFCVRSEYGSACAVPVTRNSAAFPNITLRIRSLVGPCKRPCGGHLIAHGVGGRLQSILNVAANRKLSRKRDD